LSPDRPATLAIAMRGAARRRTGRVMRRVCVGAGGAGFEADVGRQRLRIGGLEHSGDHRDQQSRATDRRRHTADIPPPNPGPIHAPAYKPVAARRAPASAAAASIDGQWPGLRSL
jgi:hypothetical protein